MKIELYIVLLTYIIYTPIWHCRIHFYANSVGKSLMKTTAISSLFGLLSMVICMNIFSNIGIYYGFLSITIFNLFFIVTIAKRKWELNISWSKLFVGIGISFITFYLTYFNYKIIYSIIFIIISILLSIYYVVMKKESIKV